MTETGRDEAALEPDRPIIDPHLHLWEILPAPGLPQQPQRFLFPDLLATIAASATAPPAMRATLSTPSTRTATVATHRNSNWSRISSHRSKATAGREGYGPRATPST